ncbi:hypothetical protein AOCH_002222 [Aspergillus ochraceoroseus]|uniref:Proteasome component (Ecm29) n=1 Tax=Aspergillus ochraceoroseus TaxID=138278 RepID=A0A0F8UZ31_9EURO|nr:hypothetical protein AOCH_002222 [Aspergillus ochraceoroseus]
MASENTTSSSEARELSLISKVELRIALADTDQKLDALLNTYLAPLLLKLSSDSLAVRNKVISVCQHVNTRIKAPAIKLPVAALLKQFKEQKSQLIRHFDLIYLQQGIDRLGPDARVEILVPLLQGISEIGTATNQGAVVFNLVLRLLPLLKLPPKDSEDDLNLKSRLGLSDQDTAFLSSWFTKLLLLLPVDKSSSTCPGLSPADYSFLNKGVSVNETWDPSVEGGLNLTETKVRALRLISSGAFSDSERLFPAIVASADANSRLSDLGEELLKRFIPDLENPDVVQQLYSLYSGAGTADGAPPARPSLQTRLLVSLGKSVRATMHTDNVIRLIEEGLLSDSARSSQGLQASKLRTQIFNFTTWVVRMGSPSDLKRMAPKIITGLMDFIRSQGWPSPGASGQRLPATDLTLRGLAYESIGIMLPKVDFAVDDGQETLSSFELIRWLFTSLSSDDSGPQIFVSIEQALGSILNSSVDSWDEKFQEELRPFLVHQMGNHPGEDDSMTGYRVVRGPQYAAVRFSNRFLPYGDIVARWVDLMAVASGSERHQEIAEEGRKGLNPYWYRLLNPAKEKKWAARPAGEEPSTSWFKFPAFSEATKFLLGSEASTAVPGLTAAGILSSRYRNAFAPAIGFLCNILLWESLKAAGINIDIEQDWETKLDVMLSSDESTRAALKQYLYSTDQHSVVMFLEGALAGLIHENRQGLQQCGEHFVSISSLAANGIVGAMVPRALLLKSPLSSNDQEAQNTAARAMGILGSHPTFAVENLVELVTEFSTALESWESAIGEKVLKVRGAMLAQSFLLSRLAFRKAIQKVPEAQVNGFIKIVFAMIETSRDSLLRQSAQVAIGQLSLSGILSPDRRSDAEWDTVKTKLVQDAKAESSVAITAIGLLSLAFPDGSPQFKKFLDALSGLHEIRSPEVHFTVGAALCGAVAGWNSKALAPEFDVDDHFPDSTVPTSVLADMCDKVIADCAASKPSLRKASAIWLLCLVKNCGHMPEIQDRLRKCQHTFASLLGDRDEMVQETGAQGLSLVYEMGDRELKDDLVHDLVNSFTATNSGLGGGKVTGNTELFEPGALPTGGGSSVNTYKDIMNLASEAGDPTLVYRFMSLASNNAIWTNRAAFSKMGISSIFSDSSVNGYLAKNNKIYPKLFRYRFDPNPNVQRSMNTIWLALVKDPNAVITSHFDEIMSDLLKSMMSGREWRPESYAKYVDEIFTKAFKLLDDIKETVRISALKLCQTITNAVIRTLETSGEADTKRVRTMLESTIPFLLSDKGMESGVQEVQGFALGALIQIIKKSAHGPLRSFVPSIIEQFLNCLSSLEPQAVNYVHLNADKYGLTGQEIDKMRLSSIRTSPMMEVIERYLIDMLDDASMKEFATRLEGVLRGAVGLPSKVGCSRVLVLLSMRTVLFQPYADRFIQLLGKYVLDRNDTVSASYCSSIGYLMRLASDERVLKTLEYAESLYLTAEEANQRVISAEILHSAAKLSNDRFMGFASSALPFVFVAKHDLDEHVREVFDKTWQDNVGGNNRTVSLYIQEITKLVADNLDSPRWAIKHTAALAIADAIISLDAELDLATSKTVWPVLEKALAGKTWDGKEAVLKALVRFVGQAKRLWHEQPQLGELVKTITIREAKRNNPAYRPHGLVALGGVALGGVTQDNNNNNNYYYYINLMPEAMRIVSKVLDDLDEDDDARDRMDVDSGSGSQSNQILGDTLVACVKCLLQCFNPAAFQASTQPQQEDEVHSALKGYLAELPPTLDKALKRGDKNVQITLYEELHLLLNRLGTRTSNHDRLGAIQGELATLVGGILSYEIDGSVEAIRKGRAQASASYVGMCQETGLEIDAGLRARVAGWRDGERSGPVRQVLDQVMGQL